MNVNLFHIFEKFEAPDALFTGNEQTSLVMYRYKFTTIDRDHAIHITSNDDGRYVFTTETAYHNVNG